MAQLMPLLLIVSCFSKIQTGFTFLVPAHLGSPGKRAVKRVCVCVWSEYFCLKTGASKRVSVSNNLGSCHNRKANSVHPKIYKNDGSNNLYNIYITLFVLHFITSDWWREDLLLLLHREKQVTLSHQTSAYIRKHFIGLRKKLQFNHCGGCDMALATTTVATC